MSGLGDELKGKAKEVAGDLTNNDKLQADGKKDQIVGNLKDRADDVKDAAGDKLNDALDSVKDKTDKDSDNQ